LDIKIGAGHRYYYTKCKYWLCLNTGTGASVLPGKQTISGGLAAILNSHCV